MREYSGKIVYGGIVKGNIIVIKKKEYIVKRKKITNIQREKNKLQDAIKKAKDHLENLYNRACKEVGEAGAEIFQVHQMLLDDEDFLDAIKNMIDIENVNAEYAVAVSGDNFSKMFESMDNEYMRERATDIKDVSHKLIQIMQKSEDIDFSNMTPSIVVADELTPSETVQIDKKKILAFVTVRGSINSHTAILARMMNIPALVGVSIDLETVSTGMRAVVDGFSGKFFLDPDEKICMYAEKMIAKEKEKIMLLQSLRGKENVTGDGRHIDIFANISSIGDIAYVLENDAGGIGLFRSEFLFLGRNALPTEEEQFFIYKQVLQTMADKKVIVRTLDIGADKQLEYLNLDKEENPAMGYRAIRICLTQPEIFKPQLRALLRAAVYGNLSILYPMIISIEEVIKINEIVKEVAEELKEANIPFIIPEQGIMIETPAAVLISDELAKLVDFFSVGTNDLSQYTLAIDRQNEKLDKIYNKYHKSVLRMIQMVTENAHKEGKWVGICGELGADPALIEFFMDIGIDELSVVPSMILKIRKIVREM